MPIAITCSGCQARLNVRDELAGKRVKCAKCGGAIRVPAQEAGDDEFDSLLRQDRADQDDEFDEAPRSAPPPARRKQPATVRRAGRQKSGVSRTAVIIIASVAGGVLVVTAGALTLAQLAKSATRNKELEEYFGRTMSIQSQTESTFLDSTHLLGNCITGNCDTTAPLRKALQTAIQTSQSAGMAFSMLVPPAHGEYTQELLAAAREWNDKVAPALKRHSENILAVVEDRSQPALDRLRAMLPELQKDEAEEKAVNQRLRAAMRTFFDKNNMKVPEQFAVFIAGMQSFSDLGQLTFLIHDIEQAIQMEAQRSR